MLAVMPDPDAVTTREDLAGFVRALVEDYRAEPASWENDRLDRYLEALAGWIGDMDGWFQNRGEPEPLHPDWRLVARMLAAATIYE